MIENVASQATRKRLPIYLDYLDALHPIPLYISSGAIATALGYGEVQVRKDLASVCSGGRPKVGYVTVDLKERLKSVLGYTRITDAILVGAGKLGRSLLDYQGFQNYGLHIVAAFDVDPKAIGETPSGKRIFGMEKLPDLCRRMNIRMGIITAPASQAQNICRTMTDNGILAVWNFSPTHLHVPEGILVQNENMAASLSILSNHLTEAFSKENNCHKGESI